MAVIIPPGFAQIAVETRHTTYIRPSVNVLGVELDGVGPDPTVVAVAFGVAWEQAILPRLDNQTVLYRVRAAVGQDGGPPTTGEAFPGRPGRRNMTSLPPAMALRCRFGTSLGGRRGRGSMFLAWSVSEGNVDELGNVSPTETNPWAAALDDFIDELGTSLMNLVLLHGTGISTPPAPTPITSTGVDPVISNQVRRQLRR